jgi:hypothetical protein
MPVIRGGGCWRGSWHCRRRSWRRTCSGRWPGAWRASRRGRDPLRLDGQSYLLHYLLPNLFFHCTTTYAILREAGVALGKDDFMGAS